ncbi:MAG: hypothetical protein U0457_10015 [Candidatus Sericytochromatia bacterium]
MTIKKIFINTVFFILLSFYTSKEVYAKNTFILVPPLESKIEKFDAGFAISDTLSLSLGNTKGKVFIDNASINIIKKKYPQETLSNERLANLLDSDFYVNGKIDFINNNYVLTLDIFSSNNKNTLKTISLQDSDYFNLQEKAVTELGKFFQINIKKDDKRIKILTKPTKDINAYSDYVRGRKNYFLLNSYSLQDSLKDFDEALKNDPKFDLAYLMKMKSDSILTMFSENYFDAKKISWNHKFYIQGSNYYEYLTETSGSGGSGYNWNLSEDDKNYINKIKSYQKIANNYNYLEIGYQSLATFCSQSYLVYPVSSNTPLEYIRKSLIEQAIKINPNDSLSFAIKSELKQKNMDSSYNEKEYKDESYDEYSILDYYNEYNKNDYYISKELEPLNFYNYELLSTINHMNNRRKKIKYESLLSLAINNEYLPPLFHLSKIYNFELNAKKFYDLENKISEDSKYFHINLEGKKYEEPKNKKFNLDYQLKNLEVEDKDKLEKIDLSTHKFVFENKLINNFRCIECLHNIDSENEELIKEVEKLDFKINLLIKIYDSKEYTKINDLSSNILDDIDNISKKYSNSIQINKFIIFYMLSIIEAKNNNLKNALIDIGKALNILNRNNDINEENNIGKVKEILLQDAKKIANSYKEDTNNKYENDDYLYIGNIFYFIKNYKKALDNYEKIAISEPNNAIIKKIIGKCFLELKDYKKSEKYLEESYNLEPFDFETQRLLTIVFYRMNNMNKLKKIVFSKFNKNISQENDISEYSEEKKYLDEINKIRAFLGIKNENYDYQNQDIDQNEKIYTINKIDLKQYFIEYQEKKIKKYTNTINRRLFTPSINNILSVNSIKGLNNYFDNNLTEAKSNFEKAIKLNNLDYDSYNNLAIINIFENNLDLAMENLQKSLEIKSDNDVVMMNLGILYDIKGNKEKAKSFYSKICEQKVMEGCVLNEAMK